MEFIVRFGVPRKRLGEMVQNNIGEARRLYGEKIGRKITQDEAAIELFNMSPSGYRKWEQGVGRLNGEALCQIADKYEVSTDFLLRRTDDPTPYPPVGALPRIDKKEERLIRTFRECTPREQEVVMSTVETMADKGRAKNMDDAADERAAGA